MTFMLPDLDTLRRAAAPAAVTELGRSREGRSVNGVRLGTGPQKISLIAGCHADEPVGPRLLDHLARYLSSLPPSHDLHTRFQWWIVPHINPDGAVRNAAWSDGRDDVFDIADHLRQVVREAPGDDIEFGFPRAASDSGARPEPRAVYDWWGSDGAPFSVHASMHGMAFAAGPWFLIERVWSGRCAPLMDACRAATARLGYVLHDVERRGEKGFHRIERGFCTRPDSESMARFFLDRGDAGTAARFRPSSMETIRSHGGDTLTLVSEIPLFVTPGVGETLEPADPVAAEWRVRLDGWRGRLIADPDAAGAVRDEARAAGLHPVPIKHQMTLQWEMIRAAVRMTA